MWSKYAGPFLKGMHASASTSGSRPEQRANVRQRYGQFTGALAEPGTVLTKAERKRKRDSKIDNLDGLIEDQRVDDDEGSFSELGGKIMTFMRQRWIPFSESLWQDVEENIAPATAADAALESQALRRPGSLRDLIMFIILLVLVFGAIYGLVEYLLLATRASACSNVTTTVFMPVTQTTTFTITFTPPTSVISAISASSGSPTTTLTTTSTMYNTVTVQPAVTSVTPLSSTGGVYYYNVQSGSTYWLNGHSPSSGMTLVMATTSITVSPVQSLSSTTSSTTTSSATLTIHSTATDIETITAPPYTATTFVMQSSAITITSSSTSTTTISLLEVASSSSMRPSFAPGATSGWNWNMSSSADASPIEATASTNGIDSTQTYTQIYYWGSSDLTVSTSTSFITTTISVSGSTTVKPTLSSTSIAINAAPALQGSASSSSTTASGASEASATSPPSVSTNSSSPASESSTASLIAVTSSQMSYIPSLNLPHAASGSPVSATITANSSQGSLWAVSGTATSSASGVLSSNVTTAPNTLVTSVSTASASSNTALAAAMTASSIPSTFPSANSTVPRSTSIALSMSGYFIFNGTTTMRNTAGPATGQIVPLSAAPAHGMTEPSSDLGPSWSTTVLKSPPEYSTSFNGGDSTISYSDRSITMSRTASTGVNSSSISTPASLTTTVPESHTSFTAGLSISSNTTSTTTFSSTKFPSTSSSTTFALASTNATTTSTSSSFSNPFPPSSATASPTADCGEHGGFTMNFDDLPSFTPTTVNTTDITQRPPIPARYNHLTFSGGYVYAPSSAEPFAPVSSPNVAVFLANASGMSASTLGSMRPGEIGDGPYEAMSPFWFDAYNVSLGCENSGTSDCTMVLTGLTWSSFAQSETATYSQNVTLSSCPGYKHCQLQLVSFPASFRNMSGVQLQAFVDDQPVMFFIDNLNLGWSNNTCAAGLVRLRHP